MFGQRVNSLIFYSKLYSKYNNLWTIYLNSLNWNCYFLNIIKFINCLIYLKQKILLNNFNFFSLNNKYKFQLNINCIFYFYNYFLKLKIFIKEINNIKRIYKKIDNLNNLKQKYYIYINFLILKNPFSSITYLFYYVIKKFKQTLSLRKILKQLSLLILNIKKTSIKGIKILVSGKINGVVIAKKETCNYGLNYFNKYVYNIKYNVFYLKTKFGVLGFKFWIFLI
ncbi:ribosomal protein S3 (apicoplast) [Toxoplasma gondii RH]|uniref:Ribosomal protein S3 n=14 Tax=Toxoplasma gondii TaxID=5811 RepID=Q9MTE3_TOXGO|nr:ribosomal protein S3 [Toxoplasma gondii RH]AAD41136.1 ribosomal protein S3 [Toxoplasma gondii]EPR56695.1 putative ribosomal protein S3 [Toxoplasma gondii GT1]EPT24398.1 ribosomal protein S3, putative [Toxoplasma gondii ME49]KFG27523.1 putative ribosomal protein S3 [Toxoplasma gondii p89]KFG27551.1 putative ribosomal protein S3 [Toxoplasma gondii FOU]KFG49808.1 ribosomal protein S3, putative [Toxoplasma gondii RUB]KFG99143.1 putative ribosomal protein S3 [Toxoplasma gondii VAND]KFG99170.1|eukprot:NP_044549.1 ribosomal protein S3 (apicoplast) [Toxoplasma gondii RH]